MSKNESQVFFKGTSCLKTLRNIQNSHPVSIYNAMVKLWHYLQSNDGGGDTCRLSYTCAAACSNMLWWWERENALAGKHDSLIVASFIPRGPWNHKTSACWAVSCSGNLYLANTVSLGMWLTLKYWTVQMLTLNILVWLMTTEEKTTNPISDRIWAPLRVCLLCCAWQHKRPESPDIHHRLTNLIMSVTEQRAAYYSLYCITK